MKLLNKNIVKKLSKKKLISSKNIKQVVAEAIVPGAYFIFPILNSVKKNKLNFLIIFYYRDYCFLFSN